MKVNKIIFTDPDKTGLLFFYEDGSTNSCAYPPPTEEDKQKFDDFGGLYEVERAWIDYHKDLNHKATIYEKFENAYAGYVESLHIDAIVSEQIEQADMMKIKMSMFKKDEVKNCKNTEMLTNLRKADNIVDVMMYYGMIKNGITA